MKSCFKAEYCRLLNLMLYQIKAAESMTPEHPLFQKYKEQPQMINKVVDDVEEEVGSVSLDEREERLGNISSEETVTHQRRTM